MSEKRLSVVAVKAVVLMTLCFGCSNAGAPSWSMRGFAWTAKPMKIAVDGVDQDWNLKTCESTFGKPILSVRTENGMIGFWKSPGFGPTRRIYDVRAFDAKGQFVSVISVSENADANEVEDLMVPAKSSGK